VNNRIAIIGNSADTLLRFRTSLIQSLASNHQVFAICPDFTADHEKFLASMGVIAVRSSAARFGMNPIKEFWCLTELIRFFIDNKISVSFSYFLKPVIYSSIASYFARVPRSVCLIEGLGYIFTSPEKPILKLQVLKSLISNLLKFSLPLAEKVVFLNHDDAKELKKIIPFSIRSTVLGGIGVDLNYYKPQIIEKRSKLTFLIIARILKEKGINEFIKAAKKMNDENMDFWIVGGLDTNPGSISEKQLRSSIEYSNVTWFGQHADVRDFIAKCDVFVLPSYREGLPRSTQEAMAMGKAIITTDVEGCRDTVINHHNGLLIPPKSVDALAESFLYFKNNSELIEQFGINSRVMAEELFSDKLQDEKLKKIILGDIL
jgi:glycosyltransferase involved in cell wall biosynthesis